MPHQFPCNLTPRQMYDYMSADLENVPVEVYDAIEAADFECLVVGEGKSLGDWTPANVVQAAQDVLKFQAKGYEFLFWVDEISPDHPTLAIAYRKSEFNFTGA
jgi:hypothetical protein